MKVSEQELFTAERAPLGPVAVFDTDGTEQLMLLYDEKVKLHLESKDRPPSFIVGRRGSGKTALLLSQEFDPKNLAIRLSTIEALNDVHQCLVELKRTMLVSVETAAKMWSMLLWCPVGVRVAQLPDDRRDPRGHMEALREAVRELVEGSQGSATPDDAVLRAITRRFLEELHRSGPIVSMEEVRAALMLGDLPLSRVQELTREIVKERRLPVAILIDSLENLGDLVDQIEPTLHGLFHLVGRQRGSHSELRIQCCFPSELWPRLSRISSNPTKDFASRLVLQWRTEDLKHVCSSRLAHFLRANFPGQFSAEYLDDGKLLENMLPLEVTNNSGRDEQTIVYILRHTQLLPRQVLQILNRVMELAIAESPAGPPSVRSQHVVQAVLDTEGLLCSEVFSAHSLRYPHAEEVASALLPELPFRFTEERGHKAWNRCAAKRELQLTWAQVRTMLADIGILGRLVNENEQYLRAEFAYTVPGRWTLAPHEEYCLHPLFVREFRSSGLHSPFSNARSEPQKSVHPIKTQPTQQGLP